MVCSFRFLLFPCDKAWPVDFETPCRYYFVSKNPFLLKDIFSLTNRSIFKSCRSVEPLRHIFLGSPVTFKFETGERNTQSPEWRHCPPDRGCIVVAEPEFAEPRGHVATRKAQLSPQSVSMGAVCAIHFENKPGLAQTEHSWPFDGIFARQILSCNRSFNISRANSFLSTAGWGGVVLEKDLDVKGNGT